MLSTDPATDSRGSLLHCSAFWVWGAARWRGRGREGVSLARAQTERTGQLGHVGSMTSPLGGMSE